jgi:hypothetical protein
MPRRERSCDCGSCRRCKSRELVKRWQRENPEKARAKNRRWYAANIEKARAQDRAYARSAKGKATQRRRRQRDPEKVRARALANKAKRRGKLVPQPCEVCGATEQIEMHHRDHSRPYDVRWLCRPHHRQVDREDRDGDGAG